MLASITPLGERSRRQRFPLTVAFLVGGAVMASTRDGRGRCARRAGASARRPGSCRSARSAQPSVSWSTSASSNFPCRPITARSTRLVAPLPRLGLWARVRCSARPRRRDDRHDIGRLRDGRCGGACRSGMGRGCNRGGVRADPRHLCPDRSEGRLAGATRRVPPPLPRVRADGPRDPRSPRRHSSSLVSRRRCERSCGVRDLGRGATGMGRHASSATTAESRRFTSPASGCRRTDGEFGTRATAEMTGDAIFLALTEYRVQPRDLERGIFAKPQPHEVNGGDAQRAVPGSARYRASAASNGSSPSRPARSASTSWPGATGTADFEPRTACFRASRSNHGPEH